LIAFASAVTKPDVYRRTAEPGIRRIAEADSEIIAADSVGSIFASYNVLLERAAGLDALEALVLLHQDTEIMDPDFCGKVREALSDPDVGVVGCVGAIDVRSIAWWEGSVALASFVHRFEEHGGGEVEAFSWAWADAPPYARIGEVETLDGFLLVLSPWVVRNIRFDESLGQLHGYDFDFCLQVREAGRKVVTADFRAAHDHALLPFSDPESWIDAHIRIAEKWDGRMPHVGKLAGSWRERALLAEAQRDAARAVGYSTVQKGKARRLHLERALAEARSSTSWRVTAPLRLLGRLTRVAR
jgi:GT2 family glycosyltransferase